MELYFFGRFQTKSGQASAFEALLPALLHASRTESGCLSINIFRSLREPTLFFIHSRWQHEAAFDFHAEQPHTLEFLQNAKALLAQLPETTRTQQFA